jgi:hypothetical protein
MVNNLRKVQFEYLEFLFKGMFSVKSKYYPNSTFFKKDDKVVLELEKSGTLWVLYSVWSNISDMFSYDYGNTQQLIKEWVEAQLKKELVAPLRASGAFLLRTAIVEEKFKSGVVVPEGFLDGGFTQVEKQLKQEEITPLQGCVSPFSIDGEELTPQQMNYVIIGEIEEESKSAEVTPKNAIAPPSSWRNLKSAEITPFMEEELAWVKVEEKLKTEEITPRSAIAPPSSWKNLKSVKYAEITPTSNKFVEFRIAERRLNLEEIKPTSNKHVDFMIEEEILNSEEITPRQVVPGSFDWVQEQIKPEKTTGFIDSVRWKKMND